MHLLIDNYDSFTYNIAQSLGELGEDVRVVRNDGIDVAGIEALAPETIVISPGPGRPDDAGICKAVIARFADRIPVLGVCLGHQCIVEAFGGRWCARSASCTAKFPTSITTAARFMTGCPIPSAPPVTTP